MPGFFNVIGRDPRKKRDLKWLSTRGDHQLIIKILKDILREWCTTTVTFNFQHLKES